MIYSRILNLDLPRGKSAFLWGPRGAGKSTYLRQKFPQSIWFDFLDTDFFFEVSKRPAILRERLLAEKDHARLGRPIIMDEVQKVPQVLDEVHWLIENKRLAFILCGSSARKLRRGHANLLGGRAWRYELFPLVSTEVGQFNLLRILNRGMIPSHYLEDNYQKALKSYIQDYLKEEVLAEGLLRNIPAFSRFLDSVGYGHGEMTNFSNIARDCGVDSKTVREYYRILEDTLLGKFVRPYSKRRGRQEITKASKFYLFDVGIAGFLSKRVILEEKGPAFGKALEHFILMEIAAYLSYKENHLDICFWRTKTGQEVDFILGDAGAAIEVKGTSRVDDRELRSLNAFREEFHPPKALVVSNETAVRKVGEIEIIPWRIFLSRLWEGGVI